MTVVYFHTDDCRLMTCDGSCLYEDKDEDEAPLPKKVTFIEPRNWDAALGNRKVENVDGI